MENFVNLYRDFQQCFNLAVDIQNLFQNIAYNVS